jgi:hypothetical protein
MQQLDVLVQQIRSCLRESQFTFAASLDVSDHTVRNWELGRAIPTAEKIQLMVRRVYPADRALAAELVKHIHQNLYGLGLEPLPVPAPMAPSPLDLKRSANVALLAGAEASDLSPVRLRAALLATLDEAHALNLSLADLREGLFASSSKAAR